MTGRDNEAAVPPSWGSIWCKHDNWLFIFPSQHSAEYSWIEQCWDGKHRSELIPIICGVILVRPQVLPSFCYFIVPLWPLYYLTLLCYPSLIFGGLFYIFLGNFLPFKFGYNGFPVSKKIIPINFFYISVFLHKDSVLFMMPVLWQPQFAHGSSWLSKSCPLYSYDYCM